MTKTSLKDKIASAITSSGFALEMKVAGELTKRSLFPYQSIYFTDANTDIEREVDLVATKMTVVEGHAIFKISLVIQCKWSKKAPWIIFLDSLPVKDKDSGLLRCLYDDRYSAFVTGLSKALAGDLVVLSKISDKVGYGMTSSLFKDAADEESQPNHHRDRSKDTAYEAFRSVVSGSEGILDLARKDMERGLKQNLIHIVVPLIVVDGKIFNASHGVDGVECEEVDDAMILYNGDNHMAIRVCTFERFAAKLNDIASDLGKIIKNVSENGHKYLGNKTRGVINRI